MAEFFPDQPLRTRLLLLKLRSLERFAAILAGYGPQDHDCFHQIVQTAVNAHGVAVGEMAEALHVTPGTVRRWGSNETQPIFLMTQGAVAWIKNDVDQRAADLRGTLLLVVPGLPTDWPLAA